jgi:hypothetical protein
VLQLGQIRFTPHSGFAKVFSIQRGPVARHTRCSNAAGFQASETVTAQRGQPTNDPSAHLPCPEHHVNAGISAICHLSARTGEPCRFCRLVDMLSPQRYQGACPYRRTPFAAAADSRNRR